MKKKVMSFQQVIMLAVLEKAKKVTVIHRFSEKSSIQIAGDAKHYVDCMTTNVATFASPTPTLSTITALAKAVTDLQRGGTVSAEGRSAKLKVARKALEAGLITLGHYVEDLANLDPKTAVATVQLAGMEVKHDSTHSKPPFEMKQGKNSGDLIMTVKAASRQMGHDYQLSTDGINFKSALKTDVSSATITGLVPGTLYYGRVMRTIKGGEVQIGDVIKRYVI